MAINPKPSEQDLEQLRVLEAKTNALLPPRYQGCFEDVSPKSMGSAKLKYAKDGRVVWDEIWTSFCHLALAGGPPHRGTLLEPVAAKDVEAAPEDQKKVAAEIERGIRLTTGLHIGSSPIPGWVAVQCDDETMAAWLVKAIVAENVIARHDGNMLLLPAGPHFRLEKEIKNVVTSTAKTCHYLCDHMEVDAMPKSAASKLIEPLLPEAIANAPEKYELACQELERTLREVTQLETVRGVSAGWIGVRCLSEEMAVWMLRAVAVADVLVRREGDVLFVPVCLDGGGRIGVERVVSVMENCLGLWRINEAVVGGVR